MPRAQHSSPSSSPAIAQVDIVSIHVPLNHETKHLIDTEELRLVKVGAILINTSRGGVVNEPALLDALRSGHLAGAALDVFEDEPMPPGHPVLNMADVVVSGHVAAFSRLAAHRTLNAVADALIDASNGRLPKGCVNPDAFDEMRPR